MGRLARVNQFAGGLGSVRRVRAETGAPEAIPRTRRREATARATGPRRRVHRATSTRLAECVGAPDTGRARVSATSRADAPSTGIDSHRFVRVGRPASVLPDHLPALISGALNNDESATAARIV